jgi:hypothetical protein
MSLFSNTRFANNGTDYHTELQPVAWEPKNVFSEETGKEEDIVIRALNPDNRREVEMLVELFVKNFGTSYPFQQVYDHEFWAAKSDDIENSDDGLISIVGVDEKRFVAHLALRPEKTYGRVEMLLPAIHPSYRKQVFKMSRLFWRCILEQAKRQNWSLIYHYSLISHPVSQLVSAKCFHSDPVLFLPNYIPSNQYRMTGMWRPNDQTSILVMYNVLQETAIEPVTLYPPVRHARMIEKIYQPLKLNRSFKILNENETSILQFGKNISLHDSASSTFCIERFNLCHLMLTPSKLPSLEYAFDRIKEYTQNSEKKLFIHIALDDILCPILSKALELKGYKFCGALPLQDKHDYIVFGKFEHTDVKDLVLYSDQAKALRDYLANNSSTY